MKTPGVKDCATVVGYNLVSGVAATYNTLFFINLEVFDCGVERTLLDPTYRSVHGWRSAVRISACRRTCREIRRIVQNEQDIWQIRYVALCQPDKEVDVLRESDHMQKQ